MKSLKILSMLAFMLLTLVGCSKDDGGKSDTPNPEPEPSGSLEGLEKEWQLVSVNGTANEFGVYISFEHGLFSIYQQVYTLDYKYFDGEYTVKGTTISGEYYDAGEWKCTYTGGISEDGNTLTLKSNETNPVTCVYKACEIPQQIKDEALSGTRGVEVTPFL
jgi:hypothetical protein